MRTDRSLLPGLYVALLAGLTGGSLGCSQLWRPFLQDVEAPPACSDADESGCDPRCDPSCDGLDLGVPVSDLGGNAEWEVIPTGITTPLRAVWGLSSEKRVYFGGDNATLLSIQPGGQVVQESLGTGYRFSINAITGDPVPTDPTSQAIVAVGTDNTLLYWSSTGWVPRNPGSTLDGFRGAAYTNSSTVWFAGGPPGAGSTYYGRPAGPYTAVPVANPKAIWSVWPTDQSSVWLGAEQATLYRAYSGGMNAYTLLTPGNIVGIWGNNATGTSTPPVLCDFGPSCMCDGGLCSSLKFYAVQPGAVTRFDPYGGFFTEPRPTKVPPAVTYTAIYGNASGQLWVTGQRGVVLHYDGKEWAYLDVGTSADLYGVWVAPGSKRPWLVGDNGLVMRHR